jgi:polar amino acid transport system substrate-binding protein
MKLQRLFHLACIALAATFAVLPAAASAQTPGTLRVATDATFAPMEFTEHGQRVGFDIDIMNALAKAMGKHVAWTDIDFKGLVPGLIAHRFDVAISAIYITPERSKVVDFTEPYYAGGLVVLVRSNSPIKDVGDLDGKKVTVQVGTKSVNFLRDNFPKIQRVEVEKNDEMFDLVGIGRADAAVTGRPAAMQVAKTRPGFRVLDKPLTTEAYGIAVRQDEPQLKAALNTALQQIKANGTYATILHKWFGPNAHE